MSCSAAIQPCKGMRLPYLYNMYVSCTMFTDDEWIQCSMSYSGTIQPYKRMKLLYLLLTCMNPDDIMLIETSQNQTNMTVELFYLF